VDTYEEANSRCFPDEHVDLHTTFGGLQEQLIHTVVLCVRKFTIEEETRREVPIRNEDAALRTSDLGDQCRKILVAVDKVLAVDPTPDARKALVAEHRLCVLADARHPS
jgi:hypothetical protein